MLHRLNEAISYIEANLDGEIETEKLARITCIASAGFLRFFSYMTGMSLKDHIRRRRLSRAAYELRKANARVIDLAVTYGYGSADAFTRAFTKQHGITPWQAHNLSMPLCVYPPASFHIFLKGAVKMEWKLVQTNGVKVCGLSKQFTGVAADRFEQEHIIWGLEDDTYRKNIHPEIPGVWFGIWDAGTYWIAKAETEPRTDNTQTFEIPAGTYAMFYTEHGGFAGSKFPKLRAQIFDSWLPDAGYQQARDLKIEGLSSLCEGRKGKAPLRALDSNCLTTLPQGLLTKHSNYKISKK